MPLEIGFVAVPHTGGIIGMTICPGMTVKDHARSLDEDIAAIKVWGATALVTLIADYELEVLSASALPRKVQASRLEWHHLPIMNRDAPYEDFEEKWITSGRVLRQRLRQGERILLHCVYGLGRSGMIAARLLVELGEQPKAAICRVRAARPGAVETAIQERHVLQCQRMV